nr:hypothetical protein CFP56_32470 [Quercus suber]
MSRSSPLERGTCCTPAINADDHATVCTLTAFRWLGTECGVDEQGGAIDLSRQWPRLASAQAGLASSRAGYNVRYIRRCPISRYETSCMGCGDVCSSSICAWVAPGREHDVDASTRSRRSMMRHCSHAEPGIWVHLQGHNSSNICNAWGSPCRCHDCLGLIGHLPGHTPFWTSRATSQQSEVHIRMDPSSASSFALCKVGGMPSNLATEGKTPPWSRSRNDPLALWLRCSRSDGER